MTSFALTARPKAAAIAWATKTEIFVEIPCRDGPPYVCRYPKSTTGLASALNILIENADPGFDWIFSRGIGGLITKFGGSNSHMAIRCSEFALPAAIGCGEQLYEVLRIAQAVEVDAVHHVVRPLAE